MANKITPAQEYEKALNFTNDQNEESIKMKENKFFEYIKQLNSNNKIYPFVSICFNLLTTLFISFNKNISGIKKILFIICYIIFLVFTIVMFKNQQ